MSAFSFLTTVKYLFLYQSCGDVVLGALIPPSTFFVFGLSVSWHDNNTSFYGPLSRVGLDKHFVCVCDTEKESELREGISCKTATQKNHNCVTLKWVHTETKINLNHVLLQAVNTDKL